MTAPTIWFLHFSANGPVIVWNFVIGDYMWVAKEEWHKENMIRTVVEEECPDEWNQIGSTSSLIKSRPFIESEMSSHTLFFSWTGWIN